MAMEKTWPIGSCRPKKLLSCVTHRVVLGPSVTSTLPRHGRRCVDRYRLHEIVDEANGHV